MDFGFITLDLLRAFVMLGFTVLGWFLRELYSAVKELKSDLIKLREQMHEHYVRKDDFKEFKESLMTILQRIENKLDKKADKE
jgi:hypothetical protein